MRTGMLLGLSLALSAPALAGVLSTQHLMSQAALDALGLSGFEFTALADTESVGIYSTFDPLAGAATPYYLWAADVPRAFQVTYNPTGDVQGMSVDTTLAMMEATQIETAANGLLISGRAIGGGRQVSLTNLIITLPSFAMYPVGDTLLANALQPEDYLLVTTDLPLANGFILSGSVSFDWSGSLFPTPPEEHWFSVAPVMVPEPATSVLLVAGALGIRRRRA